jgi:antitoxin (DNA-binding transcriptional repressor) of toxin-antitoxin stability system
MIATAKDLRFKISMLFDALNNGEEITITYRGKARAKLIPVESEEQEKEDIAFGMWRDKKEGVEKTVQALRKGRVFDV